MNHFFATCGRGLEPYLANELKAIGAAEIEQGRGGVSFVGDRATLYRANLWLRTAVRVLQPIFKGPVFSPEELYEACRTIRWFDLMTPDHTLAVDCNVHDSNLTHSQYAARKVKDAICDQFRDRTGRRPSVDVDRPMIGLNLHVARNVATLSLDASWDSLHKRGYRPVQTRAPLNESLAAGLLYASGYDGTEPLADPLCGSGTLCVEAAGIALNRAPGLARPWYSFQGWLDFEPALWSAIKDDARRSAKHLLPRSINGSDAHRGAVELAHENARAAGLGHLLRFDNTDFRHTPPPPGKPGLLICNPPYGERLGSEAEWVPLYRSLGEAVKTKWAGWRLVVFTSNTKLANEVGLNVKRQTPFFNGSLACKLWEYESA